MKDVEIKLFYYGMEDALRETIDEKKLKNKNFRETIDLVLSRALNLRKGNRRRKELAEAIKAEIIGNQYIIAVPRSTDSKLITIERDEHVDSYINLNNPNKRSLDIIINHTYRCPG